MNLSEIRSFEMPADQVRTPVRFDYALDRLNEITLPKLGQRVVYEATKQTWRLVDLNKSKPLTRDDVIALAYKTGAISEVETVMGT
jgi:hypothetical protein